jgi:hypothetical protein
MCVSTLHAGSATVVWISIDGFRHDYLRRVQPPTLSRLAKEGAFTTLERPIFPSLTFPNHAAQVTGTYVDHTGIPSNTFLDTATGQSYNLPDQQAVLRDEPIWVTAKRQGLRVAVIDWPMSHAQSGEWKSDYFDEKFDMKRSDQERIDQVVQMLKIESVKKTQPPLRLVITYLAHIDTIGHRNGPDSKELDQAVREADETIGGLLKTVIEWFDGAHSVESGDDLYVIVTTDHGMEPTKTLVNLDRAIGVDLVSGAKILTSACLADVYLTDVPAEQRAARVDQILAKLKPLEYLKAWRASDVPPEFHFADPTRAGDVIVLLAPGYAYTTERNSTTRPTTANRQGNHGYDPAVCPNMFGTAIVWRYRQPLGGIDLGPVDNTQWHATVAKLLGIERAAGSDPRVISLERR